MLKIVRSSGPARGVIVGGRTQGPAAAREIQFKCSACNRTAQVRVPWDATAEERGDLVRKALHEHRVIGCTERDSQARRTYAITYPRG